MADLRYSDIEGLNTILYCNKWIECANFYSTILGLPVSTDRGWFMEFQVGPCSFLSIADENRALIKSTGRNGITLSFRVKSADSMRKILTQRGVIPDQVREHAWGGRSFFLHDPEGRRIEIWSK